MNRETIFAIVFGILLGVGVGFFVLFQTNREDKAKVIPVAQETQKKQVAAKAPVATGQTVLTITSPQGGMVSTKKDISIKGKAPKNSLIVVQSPLNRDVVKNEAEDFSLTFSLAPGENIINMSAYTGNSSPQEATLQVYYVQE